MTGFIIRRVASRFAKGELRDAIRLVQNHNERVYETEHAAMQRVCEEACLLHQKFGVQPDLRPERKGGALVIADDAQGVVFTIVGTDANPWRAARRPIDLMMGLPR
jgi:hypothetical protein